MDTNVISTLGMPATAAEVYMVYARFSVPQLHLMQSLINQQESDHHPSDRISVIPSEASSGQDVKLFLERIISGVLEEKTSVQQAAVLLEYVKIYSGLSSVVGTRCRSVDPMPVQPGLGGLNDASSAVPAELPVSNPVLVGDPTVTRIGSGVNISDFERKYVAFKEPGFSQAYVRDIRSAFKWLKEKVGDVRMADLDVALLEQLFAREYGRARHNAARFYRTLKAAFEKGASWGDIRENPFSKFRLTKIPETTAPHVTEKDLEAILDQKISSDYKDLFTFALDTGMRLGEIVNMRWRSVDLDRKEMKVTNTKTFTTKGKKERLIPISDRLYKILVDRRARAFAQGTPTYVFERRGKKFNSGYVSRKFKKAVRLAGLDEDLHFHSCRHGFGTSLIRANANPVIVKELMGHSELATTLRYVHPNEDDLVQAIKKLDSSKTTDRKPHDTSDSLK